nr:uncharacterized protein LOC129283041 [Lytechinus pictus]
MDEGSIDNSKEGHMNISTRSDKKRFLKELADEVETPGNIFTLSKEEKTARLFHLRYSTREDVYYRYGRKEPALKGWKEGAFTVVNMQRYHANKGPEVGEWTYLTRRPRHSSGSISWLLDLTQSGLVVDQVYALTYSRTLSGGNINYDMRRPDCLPSKKHNNESHINGLIFAAYLDGGLHKRERAQTQLFFQDCLEDPDGFPFDLLITLKPSDQQELKTNKPSRNQGPLQPLSFPPRPRDVPSKPTSCTCGRRTHREHRISASIADFRDTAGCYEQDERDIIASEKPEKSRMEITPESVDSCSMTKDNGSVLPTEADKTIPEAISANPHKGNGGIAFDQSNRGSQSKRTMGLHNSEASKHRDEAISRKTSGTSTAWEHPVIDQENLVGRRQKTRCVIL